MERVHRPNAVIGLVAALVVTGCTDFVVDGEGVVTSPSSGAAGSDPVGPASATASDDAPVAELEPTDQPLPPGRYTRSASSPPIWLTLGDGWRAVQLFDGFFDVQRDETIGTPDVVAVQFGRPTAIVGPDGPEAPSDAAHVAELLAANAAFEIVAAGESRIGGRDGHEVTIDNTGAAHAEVLVVPPGPLGIDPGRRLWVTFTDTDDGLLAVMVGGSIAEWQAAADAAEPVLESLEIGAAGEG